MGALSSAVRKLDACSSDCIRREAKISAQLTEQRTCINGYVACEDPTGELAIARQRITSLRDELRALLPLLNSQVGNLEGLLDGDPPKKYELEQLARFQGGDFTKFYQFIVRRSSRLARFSES